MNKKGYSFHANWPEIMTIIFAVFGAILSVFIPSAALNYATSLLIGFVIGRTYFQVRKDYVMPYVIIMCGFVIGYLFMPRYGSWQISLFLIFASVVLTYYLHEKGHIK
jgi:hypothetical protein